MNYTARSLFGVLGVRKDMDKLNGEKLHAPLAFLWFASQILRAEQQWQTWNHVKGSLRDVFSLYGQPSSDEREVIRALQMLQGEKIIPSRKIKASTESPEWNSGSHILPILAKDLYRFFSDRAEEGAWVVSVVLLRFFPSRTGELLRYFGLENYLRGRIGADLLPRVGDCYAKRKHISEHLGGNHGTGITPLDDGYMSAFSKTNGPYPDTVIPETGWIAYIGDGLSGDQSLTDGNRSLAMCQEKKIAVRFWRGDSERGYRFEAWVVIVQRRKRWGVGDDDERRREFVWILAPVPSPSPQSWPIEIWDALDDTDEKVYDDTIELSDESGSLSFEEEKEGRDGLIEEYKRITRNSIKAANRRVKSSGMRKVKRFFRSDGTRRWVLWRSGGLCENPACIGHPLERSDNGDPILEVDHICDLSKGGSDTPVNMIALCPNCHALKTRGSSRGDLTGNLAEAAMHIHESYFYHEEIK